MQSNTPIYSVFFCQLCYMNRISWRHCDDFIENENELSDAPHLHLHFFPVNCPCVTCRWHVLLDVSWVGSVAKSAEVTVLRSDPKPLLSESVGELTRVL
jgi:hypothetical protein